MQAFCEFTEILYGCLVLGLVNRARNEKLEFFSVLTFNNDREE